MKCNQICKWNSNAGCVKPYGVPCILENVSLTDKKATNADRIRAMSDEILAYFLAYSWATCARAWQKDYGETLSWLQKETEDDHGSTDI